MLLVCVRQSRKTSEQISMKSGCRLGFRLRLIKSGHRDLGFLPLDDYCVSAIFRHDLMTMCLVAVSVNTVRSSEAGHEVGGSGGGGDMKALTRRHLQEDRWRRSSSGTQGVALRVKLVT